MPYAAGRIVEQVVKEAGWKFVDSKWSISRRSWDPRTKYDRDMNWMIYHSPDDQFQVSVRYVKGSGQGTCLCSFKKLEDKPA